MERSEFRVKFCKAKLSKQNCCSKVLVVDMWINNNCPILNQPVHVGEYWNDATEGVEILDQSFVEFQDEVIIGDGAEVGGPLGEARVDVGHEVGVELVAVLLAHALVHSRVHLLVGDGFVGAGGMGQHLQCHGRFSTESSEEIPTIPGQWHPGADTRKHFCNLQDSCCCLRSLNLY